MHIPVRIVLVETSHPGNIGAVARAMKTMGLRELALVCPRHFPHEDATARASGADDVLESATVTDNLEAAIADCQHVVGASARVRGGRWPVVDARAAAEGVVARSGGERCAVVMGPEQSGLTNEHLARCHELVHIPTSPDYGSLNIAMAVQVLCYELRMAALQGQAGTETSFPEQRESPAATAAELEGFFGHLDDELVASGFLHPDHPKQLRLKLRRLFMRAALDQNEINILRGMLASLVASRPGRTDDADG